jgi:hypothetical protein
MPVLIRHLWQLKTAVFLHWCLIREVLWPQLRGSVTRKLNKNLPNFWKKMAKNAKVATPKLNLRAQNIHIKLLLKPYDKSWVQTACLGENYYPKK